MVYHQDIETNMSIDELIEALTKAKAELGGDTIVTVEGPYGELNGISLVNSNYAYDNGSGGFEFAGFDKNDIELLEDEDSENEDVVTVVTLGTGM